MRILPVRPLNRRLLISGVLLGLLLCGAAGWLIFTQSGLQGRIEAIRAAGDPATIADLAPKQIPPDDDAAAQLAAVASRVEEFGRELYRFEKTPLGTDYYEREDRGDAGSEAQLAAVRAIVEKYPDVAAAIKRAAACPQYASRLDYRLPQPKFIESIHPGKVDIRGAARFVARQMKLSVADGRPDVALAQGIELLRLAALYDAGEPALLSSQMAAAVRGLAVEEIYDALVADAAADERLITPAMRQELDRELARFNAGEVLRHTVTTERACVISATQHQLGGMKAIIVNTVGLPMKIMYIESIDSIEPVLAIVDQPWYVTFQPGKPNIFQPATKKRVLADMLASSFKAQFDMVHQTSATLRALRVANALQLYAIEHGKEASGIGDLSLPVEATADPFTGQPLRAKLVDGRWLVYSVGVNGVDDGGDFKDHKDVGIGPPKSMSADEKTDDSDE